MILHVIKQSALSEHLLQACFATVAATDAIVFVHVNEGFWSTDGECSKRLTTLGKTNRLYYLDDSLDENLEGNEKSVASTLPDFVRAITMDQFVELTAEFPKSQSWF